MGRENILLLACLYYCCPFDIGISVSMGVGHILKFYIKVFFRSGKDLSGELYCIWTSLNGMDLISVGIESFNQTFRDTSFYTVQAKCVDSDRLVIYGTVS